MPVVRWVWLLAVCSCIASCGGDGGGDFNLSISSGAVQPTKAYVGYANDTSITVSGSLQVTGGTATSARTMLVDASGRVVGDSSNPVGQVASPTGSVGFTITLDPRGLAGGVYTLQFAVGDGSGKFSSPFVKPFNIVSNPYVSLSTMPTPRSDFTVAAVGTKIYALTGSLGTARGGTASPVVEIFDTTTNAWTAGAAAPNARIGAASAVVGSRIYLLGGYDASHPNGMTLVDVFDTNTGIWTTTAAAPTARFSAGATAIGSDIYLVGGTRDPADAVVLATAQRFDTLMLQWTTLPDVLGGGTSHPTVLAQGGKVYAAGGTSFGLSGGLRVFDPATGTWLDGPSMTYGRSRFAAAFYGDTFHAFGGDTVLADATRGPTATSEAIRPASFVKAITAPLPATISGIQGVTIGNAIYIVGSTLTYRYAPDADVL